jgi:hypothetical protein
MDKLIPDSPAVHERSHQTYCTHNGKTKINVINLAILTQPIPLSAHKGIEVHITGLQATKSVDTSSPDSHQGRCLHNGYVCK